MPSPPSGCGDKCRQIVPWAVSACPACPLPGPRKQAIRRTGPILAALLRMKRFNPAKWLRERPIDFALALVILVVCLTVAVYQYRGQDPAGATAGTVSDVQEQAVREAPPRAGPGSTLPG